MDPRSQEMRPQGIKFLETEEEILELSTVLTPWAGNAATTTTAI
jgi:alkylhydroperoxidase/carboxymuconolactone decarboxylase family protein YurZ